MSLLKKRIIALLGFLVVATTWKVTPVQAADRFYEDLLRGGLSAAEDGDSERAVELLRVACFGLLEEPAALAGCLVQLALAQANLDDTEGFRSTADRFLEIEEDFAVYAAVDLSTSVRQRFEELLRQWVKAEDLARSATLRHLVEPQELSVDQPLAEAEAVEDPARDASTSDSMNPASPTAALPTSVLPRPALPSEVTEALRAARDIQQDGAREDFTRELERLRSLAEQHPEVTDLHQMAGVLAYRLGLWMESRDLFERGGEIESRQSAMLFYFAVVLYKTDALEKAAEVLERAMPTLRRSPFVDEYVEQILGPGR